MPTGTCNCGAISVTIPEYGSPKSNSTALCHCDNCRRQGSCLGSIVMLLDNADFTITGTTLKTYDDPKTGSGKIMRRSFCGTCGSGIVSAADVLPGKSFVKMGLFDRPFPKADTEIYTSRNNSWEPLVDGATHVAEGV